MLTSMTPRLLRQATMRRSLPVAGAAAVLVGVLVVADRLAIRTYGRPPRRPAGPVPAGAADVALRAIDGVTLRAWWQDSSQREPGACAVVIHGWGGSAADMTAVSDLLSDLGLHVLVLDARGHGRSDDATVASMPAFAEDIRVALQWLRSRPGVDTSRIILVGHSVGAGACLYVASQDHEVAAVVSLASMADPRVFMTERLRRRLPAPMIGAVLRYVQHTIGYRFAEFVPVHTIGRVRAPVLLVHGEADMTVPVDDARLLHSLSEQHSTLLVLPGADHYGIEDLNRARVDLAAFLTGAGVIGEAPAD